MPPTRPATIGRAFQSASVTVRPKPSRTDFCTSAEEWTWNALTSIERRRPDVRGWKDVVVRWHVLTTVEDRGVVAREPGDEEVEHTLTRLRQVDVAAPDPVLARRTALLDD